MYGVMRNLLTPSRNSKDNKMGIIAKLFNGLKKEVRILMIGLDAAGKTTCLYKLKLGEVVTTIPTIGFNVETVQYKNIHFTVWDIGGGDRVRSLYQHYYLNTQAIIYVVDSSDRERIGEASAQLQKLLKENEPKPPVLVLINKQDLPNVLSVAEVTEKLDLNSFANVKWHCQPCCGKSGDGLYAGLDWLVHTLQDK
eukprot:TRINITY_DN3475_c0_g1_i1.p1 TRINITY_DN3475_c0_g1~~TRINITY_DN3475_c0_g1_i1.p1  ORF type:complete len:196 (-),score=21.17 TRINITY_DN3475_c0_g1_i1:88-675(-)